MLLPQCTKLFHIWQLSYQRDCWKPGTRRSDNNNDNNIGSRQRCDNDNNSSCICRRNAGTRWGLCLGKMDSYLFFSGDTAASNETNVCWVSDIKMKDQYICNFRYNWTHFKVASNETEAAGTAAPPAPTTTTTTTTTTTEKPLEPCQCLGDPSLLNNTDNAKWGSVSRKLTLTRHFQKSACLLSQHDFSHNNRWSRPCARTLPVSTSKRVRSHFAFWSNQRKNFLGQISIFKKKVAWDWIFCRCGSRTPSEPRWSWDSLCNCTGKVGTCYSFWENLFCQLG